MSLTLLRLARSARFVPFSLGLLAAFVGVGCADCGSGGGGPGGGCVTSADCASDQLCRDGVCVARPDAAGVDLGPLPDDAGSDAGPDGGSCAPCGSDCCAGGTLCVGGAVCATDRGPCTTTDDCAGDDYCEPMLLRCVPYERPASIDRDPACTRFVPPGTFSPTVECAFDTAPAGDAFPDHLHVLSTPMVVDFGIGRAADEPRRPSIVAVFDDGFDGSSEEPTGVIRILDGRTCTQQAELGSLQLVAHSAPPAVGDLDGDGRAEIVAYKAGGGLVAFHYDTATSAWAVLWRATQADGTTPLTITGGGWAGPTLVDLDDDGRPEVLRGGLVVDATGRLLFDGAGVNLASYGQGTFAVVSNVDSDAAPELVAGHGVWQWNATDRRWDREAWGTTGQPIGHVAIADFGAYPGSVSWPADAPEVVVISTGNARVQTLDGTVIFGPVALVGDGTGGPPTIGDFDGDGLPELASAGGSAYNVFDLDCTASPRAGGACATGSTSGVLWSRPSQDQSSNVTGSSIFDFEGDGISEAVYADECFVRVYDGRSGDVLFSQSHSSCTWYENPVVADVDGDFNAEIVIGANWNCPSKGFTTGRDCSAFGVPLGAVDPLFPGLRCRADDECVSGRCVEGFCRCTDASECCAGPGCAGAAFVCTAPPAGTPGAGDTCRASRPVGVRGIRVFGDAADRWVRSRPVWNQHAYHVTNVGDDGVIPRTSAAERNWTTPGFNHFRQNVQGTAVPGASPDITARADALSCAGDGTATIRAVVCNRGTDDVSDGVAVAFYATDPATGGAPLCEARTAGNLRPGACESVSCPWADAPRAEPGVDVYVVADPLAETFECRESNNTVVYRGVYCGVLF
jgi:hypothetical protein